MWVNTGRDGKRCGEKEGEMEVDKREKISKWKRESGGGRVESSRERQILSQLYKESKQRAAGCNTHIYRHNRLAAEEAA